MAIIAYYFSMVWPKITLDSVRHAESNHLNFPMSAILGIRHFEFCSQMLYFTNALTYRYETIQYDSSTR